MGNVEVEAAAYAGPDWVLMVADVVSVKDHLRAIEWLLPLPQTLLLFHCVVTGTAYWAEK